MAPASIPMVTTLLPAAGDVGQFSLQATIGPSVTDQRSWTWRREAPAITPANALQPVANYDPIAFSGVNVSETQQENVRAFLAGVLLGIAGGAVITLIAELVKLRRVASPRPTAGPSRRSIDHGVRGITPGEATPVPCAVGTRAPCRGPRARR